MEYILVNGIDLNGYKESLFIQDVPVQSSLTAGSCLKIVVVGEAKCGKSTFIETYYKKHKLKDILYGENYSVYECEYKMDGQSHTVKIIELVSGPDENLYRVARQHRDANGFILMFSIDDESSFDKITEKWYDILNQEDEGLWKNGEPAVAIGNKKDLKEDGRTIRRLARSHRVSVTEEQGRSLIGGKILDYFECSSTQLHNVHDVFERMLACALNNFKCKMSGRIFRY